jgi:hypothetical protein
MDTVLRAGKIVYSQASWILALSNFVSLLEKLKGYEKEVDKISRLARRAIQGVEENLWSEDDGCYIDVQETHHIGGPYRTLTQDVSLYLVAITENTSRDVLRIDKTGEKRKEEHESDIIISHSTLHKRAISTLDAIKKRAWKEKWPLDTEVLLHTTGPWVLQPYQYHNHTFWPWTTGIEMLARSRFDQTNECNILLSTLASDGHPHMHAFYEWVNPLTDKGNGAYPFRTGISCIRIALVNISNNIKSKSKTT